MKKPLLTAIIFTYNHHDTIAQCIESHLNQKTDYPYIIKIYDDCSIDGTTEICKEYAEKYPDKITLILQKHNTFAGAYNKMQAYIAMQNIDTKYFCIIDGDDCWCNENKIQLALDFLENNPEYIGWAHDTLQKNVYAQTKESYVHKILNLNLPNKIEFDYKAPFLLISARIFRNINYAEKKRLPIDYQLYYYHLSKGPIHYHDEIMSVYNIGEYSTWGAKPDLYLILIFSFKLSQLFDFQQDKMCTVMLKNKIIEFKKPILLFYILVWLKKFLGKKIGWYLWTLIFFVPIYGFECYNPNFIYSNRKKTKKLRDLDFLINQDNNCCRELLKYIYKSQTYKKGFIVTLIMIAILILLNIFILNIKLSTNIDKELYFKNLITINSITTTMLYKNSEEK